MPQRSAVKQLTNENFECGAYSDDVVAKTIQNVPGGMIKGFDDSELDRVFRHYAGIPKVYQDYLREIYRAKVFQGVWPENLGGSENLYTIGLTLREESLNGNPLWIKITNLRPNAIEFALQHEVGHAVARFIARSDRGQKGNFDQLMLPAFNEDRLNPKLRDYAQQNVAEYFAEAFANYYCSPESHDFIKRELPKTYSVLQANLEPPVWETEDPSSIAQPNQDIFMRLIESGRDARSAGLQIASKDELKDVTICVGSVAECTNAQSGSTPVRMTATKSAPVSGRFTYVSPGPLALRHDMVVTVTGTNIATGKSLNRSIAVRRKI